jgi:hypothetical protein
MNSQSLWQLWLPNVLIVVVVAFPAFFLTRRSAASRLAAGTVCAGGFLLLFGASMEPPISVLRADDLPVLLLGLAIAWVLAQTARALRTQLLDGRAS